MVKVIGAILHSRRTVAVGRRRRGINKAGILRERPLGKLLSVFVIVSLQIFDVGLRCRGARSKVEDGPNLIETGATLSNPTQKLVGTQQAIEAQSRNIALFVRMVGAIGHEDFVKPTLVERPNERAANEARAAGNEDTPIEEIVHAFPRSRSFSRVLHKPAEGVLMK